MPSSSSTFFVFFFAFVVGTGAAANSADLSASDFASDALKGKSLFVVFHAPWCGHCRKLMPAWKTVTEEAADKEFLAMARVDCTTTENKPLCTKNNVKGFPTIMYGTVDDLEPYEGGRDEESLQAFVQSLKPICSVDNDEHCSAEEIAALNELQELTTEQLEERITRYEEEVKTLEKQYATDVKDLQEKYRTITEKKTQSIQTLRQNSNMKMIKAMVAKKDDL